MRFVLNLDLGNATMQTGEDVAAALREVAGRVAHTLRDPIGEPEAPRNIQDVNGNTVGAWAVEGDDA